MKRDPLADHCEWLTRLFPRSQIPDRIKNFITADVYSEEDKALFKDEKYYESFRHELENEMNVSGEIVEMTPLLTQFLSSPFTSLQLKVLRCRNRRGKPSKKTCSRD